MQCSLRWAAAALTAACVVSTPLAAQWQANTGPSGAAVGAIVGGDVERYVRALSITGALGPVPWTARALTASDLTDLLVSQDTPAHPWRPALAQALGRPMSLGVIGTASVNSGFAWGANDGEMWQGRGFNGAAGVAATLRFGPLTLTAAPLAFVAQNASFPMLPKTIGRASIYASSQYPNLIDLPQRMGGTTYARVSAGESRVSVRLPGVSLGVTNASEGWGTGEGFPAILGPNAGGFPHLFVGTPARGLRVPRFGRLTARYILGSLSQSQWSSVSGTRAYTDELNTGTMRIASGLTVSYMPALLPTLELGASRFYHSPYREGPGRWDAWSKPFDGIFKVGLPDAGNADTDNQLASFFARWVLPHRGVEANIEVFRDDHNWDARDFALEPENNSAVLAAVRVVTNRSATQLAMLSLEYFDGDVRPIAQARSQGYLYLNGGLRQGHTARGQLLGVPIGAGAIAGQRVAWESFRSDGSLRFQAQRWRTQSLKSENPEALFLNVPVPVPLSHDWLIDGSVARTRMRGGRTLALEAGIVWAGVFNFGDPRTNLYARTSLGFF